MIIISTIKTAKNILFFSRAHEEWGYCQAGTSAILLADKTALIGTPGPYTWRGTVFAVSTSDVSFTIFDEFLICQST